MNQVVLIGRITNDLQCRYTQGQNPTAVLSFNVAVDRPVAKGKEKQTDFPRVTVMGKQAENLERYSGKGRLVGIQGRIQTGSYQNKNGDTVYTTDVFAQRVEFLDYGKKEGDDSHDDSLSQAEQMGFTQINEDVPF